MQNVDSTPESGSVFNEQLRDIEYNGVLNHATGQGANFALLLAMLEQNTLLRPSIGKDDDTQDNLQGQLAGLSHYRSPPLAADEQYWSLVTSTQHFIQGGELDNARLWLAMHPEPLSLHNDALHIPDEVLENCSLLVRERLKNQQAKEFKQDATGLYDILQDIQSQHVAA